MSNTTEEDQRVRPYDVVVLGAGVYGLCAARYYLEVHPQSKLLIIEASSRLGGVWSSERVYDSFWTQTVIGMAEFSDDPLLSVPSEEQYFGFFPAHYVTAYLEKYAETHVYNGATLHSRIIFNWHVASVTKHDKTWIISCQKDSTEVTAAKLIVATGLTSTPNLPTLPGQDEFGVSNIIHQKDYAQSHFWKSPACTHITVLGGGKSAADIVYGACKSGKKVSWIIRKNGSGPAAMAPAKGNAVYKNANEMLYNRLSCFFSPSVFLPSTWLSRFLHQSRIGRTLTSRIWSNIDRQYRDEADYQRPEGSKTGFSHLEPDTPLFWQNDSTGINQHPDFWSTIATSAHIYRQDISHLSTQTIHLTDSSTISASVLILATGWTPSLSFFTPTLAAQLGLPVPISQVSPQTASKWSTLDQQADAFITDTYPTLAHPPPHAAPDLSIAPFHLYKLIASPSDDSIVFPGHMIVGNAFRAAEVQALWIVAYFSRKLTLPAQEEMDREIARTVAWCRRRYPTKGTGGNWLYYDLIPYTDDLLKDIGLVSHRRGFVKPCVASDLSGLLAEYRRLTRE